MLDLIEKLLILQDRDRKIRKLEGELAHIDPQRQDLRSKTAGTQVALDQARQKVKQIESDRKSLELEVETKKQQITRYANQQLETRKNEEYRALAKEIETCKADIFKIEDREIELMEQAEAAAKEVVRATQAAAAAKQLAEDQIALLNTREKNLQQELAQLTSNRAELAAAVEETSRARYERLVRSKGENVVVGVAHGVCGGCHMKLPPQLLISCQAEKELVSCSNCGRILYYSSEMDLAIVD